MSDPTPYTPGAARGVPRRSGCLPQGLTGTAPLTPAANPESAAGAFPKPIIRLTGHPPPERQVRDQVRSATGATYVRQMSAFHSLGATNGARTIADVVAPGVRLARDLISFLKTIELTGEALPYPEQIGQELGAHPVLVMATLRQLHRNGDIALWCARDDTRASGEFKVRLPGGETILRTERAPAYGVV